MLGVKRGFARWMKRGLRFPGPLRAGEADNYLFCVRLRLRIDAANLHGLGDAADAQDVGGNAHGHIPVEVDLEHVAEGRLHDPFQPLVDVLRLPEEVLLILHPFEVGDGDAAGVAENIGNHEDALGSRGFCRPRG